MSASVIVAHSTKWHDGAADMVRQMVGDTVPLAFTASMPMAACERTWRPSWRRLIAP